MVADPGSRKGDNNKRCWRRPAGALIGDQPARRRQFKPSARLVRYVDDKPIAGRRPRDQAALMKEANPIVIPTRLRALNHRVEGLKSKACRKIPRL
jgi:hypothetical protein